MVIPPPLIQSQSRTDAGQTTGIGRLTKSTKKSYALFIAICSMALLGSVIYAPFANTGPVFCPLRFTTGIPCPGCGLTRSFCALSKGQFTAAVGYHLFGPLLYLAAAFALPLMIYQLITGKQITWFTRTFASKQTARVLAVLFTIYHLIRMYSLAKSGTLFPMIANSPLNQLLRHH